ncbi:hypothetical protein TPA0910_41490 [Streptomyces hygroscopicus subsp. sporocinereus]|uniref:Integrase catalytic domain-containing protein n=2 Tax=Streptomyces hygroscopicus TaxID=1912 RepID=A0ABQ3U2X1_STRHY|nr:DDE-type integrase/transposase/recombinase [Streptomyces hygroscopicus]GHJ29716.1 hypothetical protein TPA0910_41490 [Streptomyces hygroscopicus]
MYLTCWLDLATREVIGYAMADHHRAEPVVDALKVAPGRSGPEAGCDVHAERPGITLVGDITCLPTAEGWLHLACWLDLATREVVGYATADHHRTELVTDALDTAHGRAHLEPGCVIHSDRGSEYTSAQSRASVKALGLRQSCGRTGSCFDNAAAESLWALLKEEAGARTRPDRTTARADLHLHRDLLQPPPPT